MVPDLAWTHEEPLHDAEPVRGLVSFFTERADVVLDGVALPLPITPWSDTRMRDGLAVCFPATQTPSLACMPRSALQTCVLPPPAGRPDMPMRPAASPAE